MLEELIGVGDEYVIALLVIVAMAVYMAKSPNPAAPPPSAKPKPVAPKVTERKDAGGDAKKGGAKPSMTIFFGSQSGTAQTLSFELAKEACEQGFNAKAVDLENYDHDELSREKFAVFLMATFGEGEPTDNAITFCDWIKAQEQADLLNNTTYAVFALGNRQYELFCAVGQLVDKRMEELGAHRLVEHGEGDDDGSLEDDYNTWKSKFWEAAHAHCGTKPSEQAIKPFEPSFALTFVSTGPAQVDNSQGGTTLPAELDDMPAEDELKEESDTFHKLLFDPKNKPQRLPILVNKELRQSVADGGSTRHIELDLTKCAPPMPWSTADNLGIYPRNSYLLAGRMARRLRVNFKHVFTIKRKDESSKVSIPVPTTCSIKDALLWYCDFRAIARHAMCKHLLQYASDDKDKRKLTGWMGPNKDAFLAEKFSLQELLDQVPSVHIPFDHFIEWVPKLQPRFYTIASSAKCTPKTIHITVSLAITPLPNNRPAHLGVCSSYLCESKVGDRLWCFVRPSSFRLPFPNTPTLPLVMVGPGTGIAPFRAFIQEAVHLKEKADMRKPGPILLFFGCRKSSEDYLYKDELKSAEELGVCTVVTAFSRETAQKVYVQDKLNAQAEQIWDLIENKKGTFYVCGGAAMGRAVRECLRAAAEKHGGMSLDESNKYIKKLCDRKRYIQELWS